MVFLMARKSRNNAVNLWNFIFVLIIMLIVFLAFPMNQKTNSKESASKDGIKELTASGVLDIFECGSNETCMDNVSELLLKTRNAKELLAELDESGKKDSRILIQCHPITHSVGRTLYKKLLEENKHIADVFQQCDHTCHSGCFHGAMERVFFSDGSSDGEDHVTPQILREKVPSVCEGFDQGLSGNLRFQCLHGLGHAVVFFNYYNLIDSLKLCDLLPTDWDRSSCHGGAFMENVVASNKSKRLVSNDPHFPCNMLEEKYKNSCYLMQTSRMLELGLSYEKIGKECENVESYRSTCMISLGRDASNDVRKDPKSAKICIGLPTENDNKNCISGLVYALSDNSWDGRYAFPYCDDLPADYIDYCYKTTIAYLMHSLFIDKTALIKSCQAHSSYYDCINTVNNWAS